MSASSCHNVITFYWALSCVNTRPLTVLQNPVLPDADKAVPWEDPVVLHASYKVTPRIHHHHSWRTTLSAAELPLPELTHALVQGALQGPHSRSVDCVLIFWWHHSCLECPLKNCYLNNQLCYFFYIIMLCKFSLSQSSLISISSSSF